MKNIRVETGVGALVSWTNAAGERIALPMLKLEKEWKPVGVYLKYGTSKSDPGFAAVFALPHNYQPGSKIRKLLRRHSA